MCRVRGLLGSALLAALAAGARAEVTVRVRLVEMTPEAHVRIFWTWGGQGLGGDPVSGEWTAVKPEPAKVNVKNLGDLDAAPLVDLTDEPPANPDFTIEKGAALNYHWIRKGYWSPAIPLSAFRNSGLKFVTVYARGCEPGAFKKSVALNQSVFEFELLEDGHSIKTFTEASPSGAVCSIVLPIRALENGRAGARFLDEARGLSQLIRWRRSFMESLPWAGEPLPERYEIITDCGGYGTQYGYGVRTSSREVFFDEFAIMRQMGVNGLRNRPGFFMDLVKDGKPEIQGLIRLTEGGVGGYPFIPAPVDRSTGKLRPLPWEEGAGCPWHPVYSNRAEQARARFQEELARARELPFDTWWVLTVDEIGSAFDQTGERKEHMGVCPHCIAKFRDYLREHGLAPADFDARDWEPIRPTYGYFAESYEERERKRLDDLERARAKPAVGAIEFVGQTTGAEALLEESLAEKTAKEKRAPTASGDPQQVDDAMVVDLSDDEAEKRGSAAAARALAVAAERQGIPPSPAPALSARGWHRLNYWSRRFNNDGSAMLFTPMRDAFTEANAAKRRALAEGRKDSVEARQPWMYMYALRGNTFLMGGHSLGFFDFYRYSDNGFMYETSNRDPRVWSWDSYLCDVGRVHKEKNGLAFGIYVKPHRGAAIQRALSAVARGVRCVYWYTYGSDWAKGDTYGGNTNVMALVSRGARLIGAAEPVTWEGGWSRPPEIAVVRPRTAEFFGNSAQWEDGKWVYAALTHGHLPLEPLDENLLLAEDLARYKAIYVTGSHIRREVARKLVQYVANGGTLFTGCGGLARDEAGEDVVELLPVFGLQGRVQPVLWGEVPRYGATSLGAVRAVTNTPPDAKVTVDAAVGGAVLPLQVGYEKLRPLPGAEVLATFGDGSPALIRHTFGRGTAWIAGWYTGVEYATGVMKADYDTTCDFDAAQRTVIAAPALAAGARPPVEPSAAVVEGVRVKQPATGREAIVLMNWGFQGRNLVTMTNLTVRIPQADSWKGARSAWQGRAVSARREGDDLLLDVGELMDGDVLLLE